VELNEQIADRLRDVLAAEHIALTDESARHKGHAGARGGGGHFVVQVVSTRFAGMDRLSRHRAVYEALADLMGGRIHALSVRALTPEEWRAAG
jgi:BolA protein